MRVAYVCADPGVPVFGHKGASVHVQEVLRVLRRRGATVDLYCCRTGGPPPDDLADVAVVCVPPAAAAAAAGRERAAQAASREILQHLHRVGHADLVYERYALWGGVGMRFAAERAIPGVLEVNAPLIEEHATHRTLVDREAAGRHLTAALASATTVACVSQPVADWSRTWGARHDATVVVPNGVDTTRFRPRPRRHRRPRGRPTVGFVGSLKPWHGVSVLLQAAAHVGDIDVRIVGDGPQREPLAALAERLGIDARVTFTGAVPPQAIPRQLRTLDVAVAPYPATPEHYFSPLKLYEYLAAGLPVVASDIGQLAGTITAGVDGLLVPAGDPDALADALRTLHGSPQLRAELGAHARRTAVTRHTWDRTVEATLAAAGLTGSDLGRAA